MQQAPGLPASKLCRKCGVSKPTDQFYKSNQSACKPCHLIRCREWAVNNKSKLDVIKRRYIVNNPESRKTSLARWHIKRKALRPWETHYFAAMQRSTNPNHKHYKYYGGKGVKFLLTPDMVEFLWECDNAHAMVSPSIDRIEPNGNYEFSNCRFIEFSENSKRATKRNQYTVGS